MIAPAEHGPPRHDEGRPPAGKRPQIVTTSDTQILAAREHYSGEDVSWPWTPQQQLQWLRQGAPCTRCQYGRVFEDGHRACRRHQTAADRALIDALDARGRRIGVPKDSGTDNDLAWPYGPNVYLETRARLLDWAETHQLRYADRSHNCPAWAAGAGCPGVTRCPGLTLSILTWLDHASSWTGPAGLRLIVAAPYAVTETCAAALRTVAEGHSGLNVAVQPPGSSWYGHDTWFVMIAGFVGASEVAA